MSTTLLSLLVPILISTPSHAADLPHPEHPRPDFRREPWVNLNGVWQFDFDPKDEGEAQRWFEPGKHKFGRRITVPLPWESKLSGIGDTKYQGVAWYAREITLPSGEGWQGKNARLIIGACDFEAKVWVNGKPAGEHVGGYMPFDVDLSACAKPGGKALIVIRVKDETGPEQPTGKQTGWYTRTSGIWQTVYLEPRSESFIRAMRFTCQPDFKNAEANCPIAYEVELGKPAKGARLELYADGERLSTADTAVAGGKIEAAIQSPKLWHPDHPQLYDAKIVLKDGDKILDEVHTYFGLREVSVAKAPGRDYQYICLNGKPIYLAGALHQSFHPDGIYQYPSDEAIRSDYEYCKKIGLNFLRIHIKNAIPRELYWADKLGVLIMQDMPNYTHNTERSHRLWEENLRAAVARDYNHPAIFAWCDFNETWGIEHGGYRPDIQRWVADMYQLTKKLDPTRLVEDNSPCKYDHVITDINSWHFYINDYAAAKKHIQDVVDKTFPGSEFNYARGYKQADAPLINSEYGGIGAGSGDTDVAWCFKFLTNELRKHDKICGYVYTELSDIEWEHNGFLNYDRSEKEFGYDFWFPGMSLKDLNNPDFIVLDAEPCIVLKPGEKRDILTRISHWSAYRPEGQLTVRWRTDWRFNAWGSFSREGVSPEGLAPKTAPVTWEAFKVVDGPAITVQADTGPGPRLGALQVELLDGETVLARNYINLWMDVPSPRVEAHDDRIVSLRFDPGDFATSRWQDQPAPVLTGPASEKAFGYGSGAIEYRLRLSEGLDADQIEEIALLAELSAKARDEKLDWPERKNVNDCPQTDAKKWPTDVRLSINGVAAGQAWLSEGPYAGQRFKPLEHGTLPDDPADARGVLSHVQRYQPGSYGWLVRWTLPKEEARRAMKDARELIIRFEVPEDAVHRGGLAVYGDRVGAFPVDPTVTLRFAGPHGLGAGHKSNDMVAIHRLADQFESLIPTAEQGGHEWRFTTDRPAEDWAAPGFKDRNWRTSKGGFGTRETPNAIIGRKWTTPDIWLRTEVDLKDAAAIVSSTWRIFHDEDVEIYLNGIKVLERPGFITEYVDVPLDASAMRLLRNGRNVVAVHCRQTGGGQNIDVGLTAIRKPGAK